MKASPLPDPERWSDRAFGDVDSSAEDAIGASLRRIRAATEPSAASSVRWARRAMAPAARRPVAGLYSAAMAATLLVGGGTAAAVAWHARSANTAARATHEDRAAKPRDRVSPHRHLASAPAEPPSLPDPEPALEAPAPVPAPAPVTIRKLARAAISPSGAEARPPTAPPPLAADAPDEAHLIARAFRHLRNEGDARGALAALDERERRFGDGTLAAEAALARAEALLLLGRSGEVLPILVAIRDPRAGLTPDIRATRAELLAGANRCGEAEADFAALLAPGAPQATRERALYARASCRLRGAQPDDASEDLQRYLAEFPDGRWAPAVRAALARLRRP